MSFVCVAEKAVRGAGSAPARGGASGALCWLQTLAGLAQGRGGQREVAALTAGAGSLNGGQQLERASSLEIQEGDYFPRSNLQPPGLGRQV